MSRSPHRSATSRRCPTPTRSIDGFALDAYHDAQRFVVVSTQGKGDEAALKAALGVEADYRGFVGSRRKMASLRATLVSEGVAAEALDRVKAPAGLDIGAITPEEIALSILAEIIVARRGGQRGEASPKPEAAKVLLRGQEAAASAT